jgi:hypothetical protein
MKRALVCDSFGGEQEEGCGPTEIKNTIKYVTPGTYQSFMIENLWCSKFVVINLSIFQCNVNDASIFLS